MKLETNKNIKIEMTLDEIHEVFFNKAGPPLIKDEIMQKKFPKKNWIKKAMDKFIALKIAKKDKENPNKYIITLKDFKRGTLSLDEYFFQLLASKGQELDLFTPKPNPKTN
jgi:hypothetical protein